jgi:ubiquinone/menaquinone biosynthesis C-methylase UbiE
MKRVTRGYGLLETYLARCRCRKANDLIEKSARHGRVLDIGSGSHPFFLLNTDFFEKYGVDQMVKNADVEKFAQEKIFLLQFDINQSCVLPFADNYFDAVIMLAVLEHLNQKDLMQLLSEIFRVLKRGGSFIYTSPAPGTDFLLKLMSFFGFVSRVEIEEHKRYYSHDDMRALLQKAGFEFRNLKFGNFECGMNNWGRAKK